MKSPSADRTDVLVVGAGPVGMDLACRLVVAGLSVRVLERRTEPTTHSRSIGIHPPALEALSEIGVAGRLVAHGVPVREGVAMRGSGSVGRLTFESCPGPWRFVLAVPQWRTEQVLEERLRELDGSALVRGVTVSGVRQGDSGGVEALAEDGRRFEADWLAGCDGRGSAVRGALGIGFPGKTYPDRYVMGDFADGTHFGPVAVIFLARDGLVESFPLPEERRRWVVRLRETGGDPDPAAIAALVATRTGIEVDPTTASMTSGFGVQRYLADAMARGRVLLAGDAGHVVSPIGGQGMNLGWLDGRAAARAIVRAASDPARTDELFRAYSTARRRAARAAGRRAEFNMALGRPSPLRPLKLAAVRWMLSPRLAPVFARRFTMRGL
jgi:2-polyprenyl-6-methoxyphenol hydroxylase-like FAD-dependent oxidoreductase